MNKKDKPADKYDRILDAAIKIFADYGFFSSTISKIAKEAGVADGTIYLYFKNKEDILQHVFNYKTKEVFETFREEVDKSGNAKAKLEKLISTHLSEFQKNKDMAVVFQMETRTSRHLEDHCIDEMSKMYLDILGEIIEKGQEEGTMRRDLFMGLVKRFILGAVSEVINTWVLSGGKYDLVSMAEPLIDLYLHGIGTNNHQNNIT
ncbi:MAG: TetR/AcrR family transcriptional regulator [Desulfobacterales bacterium]|nr:TetR/AcrR family transcriptional regulator [Desulfobacterales bacterium]